MTNACIRTSYTHSHTDTQTHTHTSNTHKCANSQSDMPHSHSPSHRVKVCVSAGDGEIYVCVCVYIKQRNQGSVVIVWAGAVKVALTLWTAHTHTHRGSSESAAVNKFIFKFIFKYNTLLQHTHAGQVCVCVCVKARWRVSEDTDSLFSTVSVWVMNNFPEYEQCNLCLLHKQLISDVSNHDITLWFMTSPFAALIWAFWTPWCFFFKRPHLNESYPITRTQSLGQVKPGMTASSYSCLHRHPPVSQRGHAPNTWNAYSRYK